MLSSLRCLLCCAQLPPPRILFWEYVPISLLQASTLWFPSDMLQVQKCKTMYLMYFFQISQVWNRDYSCSWIQGMLRAHLSYPGTDSNFWRGTALGYLRSRPGFTITILLTVFIHQKIEGVTARYSHKHIIANGKLCWQFLLYPAKYTEMERSATQAQVLHTCINYNTVAFCYSFHLLNMYEFEWEERGTTERQKREARTICEWDWSSLSGPHTGKDSKLANCREWEKQREMYPMSATAFSVRLSEVCCRGIRIV